MRNYTFHDKRTAHPMDGRKEGISNGAKYIMIIAQPSSLI